ncbi:MAG TPA: enoyl-CoA hydratase/isomerase family protein [Chloroflexota bacterium]|nr:enoyl-CoA hydratase/isomerase family protein [Chloroflexota bacterium]
MSDAPTGSAMREPELLYRQDGPLAWVKFNRPQVRNAMTWAMYDALRAACERVEADPSIRALLLHGAGDKAFVAGTDIAQFQTFATERDGIDYEARVERDVARLEEVSRPTIALVRGFAVGAGASLALACDLRLATPSAQLGIPIARTLGNCLSLPTYARLVDAIGAARTKELLFTARLVGAEEGAAMGLWRVVPEADLEAEGQALGERLAAHAPLTLWATKESLRRLRAARLEGIPGEDIVARVYTSADFHEGVRAFLEKRPATWTGR